MKKLVLVGFIFIFLVNYASAYTNINIYIDEAGSALFLGETNEKIDLPLGVEIKNEEIIGKTHKLTTKQGEIWSFFYSLENAELNIILPKSTIIKSVTNGEVYIGGEGISVYSKNSVDFTYVLGEESSNRLLWIFIIILIGLGGIIILIYVFYTLKKSKNLKSKNNLEIIKKVLNEREKIIIENLKKSGKIKGSYLRKLCDIPKASFSRHLRELEQKRIIKKTGDGKNKFVELID